jgi:hypothetical protein
MELSDKELISEVIRGYLRIYPERYDYLLDVISEELDINLDELETLVKSYLIVPF